MEKYVDNLLSLGFVVPTEDPEWVSAPNIIPKKPPAMFRMAIDNRPINFSLHGNFLWGSIRIVIRNNLHYASTVAPNLLV